VPTRTAEVLFKDRLAGSLEETAGGGTRFIYGPNWQQPIACCLPVARREHEWKTGLHPFFEHLGTEGWLREQQARVAQIAEEDDLGLLLRYGVDCIGAVGIRAPDGVPPPTAIAKAFLNPGRTVSGVQRKLLVVKGKDGRFHSAGGEGPAPYIAKFNSASLPTLVRNEFLSLRWVAALLGPAEVAAFQIATVHEIDESGLVVTRFDRTGAGEKLRQEDFAQILCKPRGRDYTGKYNAGYEDVATVIRTYSARPTIDLARFFRRLAVFVLVGNCDAHLKNFSLLERPEGLRLSPVYDVLNTVAYEQHDRNLALSIAGRSVQHHDVTGRLLTEFGLSIGLPSRALAEIWADLRRKVSSPKIATILAPPEGEPPDGFVHRYAEIVSNACLRILGE
jgi:serine/threonine-protein kinase HipA